MSNAAKVNFKVTDLTQTVSQPNLGISAIMGKSVRGPFFKPDEVFNSWPSFVAKHGGLNTTSQSTLLIKRLLEKGGSIRFCRIGSYDVDNQLTAIKAAQPNVLRITFESVFLADNVINGTIGDDVGLSTSFEEVDFVESSNLTLEALAASIAQHTLVYSANVIKSGTNYSTLVITPKPGTTSLVVELDITGTTPVFYSSATVTTINDATTNDPLFTLTPKYEGADYNNFKVTITAGSNGAPGYFDIYLVHMVERNIIESYTNLKIDGHPTDSASNYLEKIIKNSSYLDVEYSDLSQYPGTNQLQPLPVEFQFTGGSDGDDPVATDYIGTSELANGFHAFDEYDDFMELAVFDNELPSGNTINLAGITYADTRKDLIYYTYLEEGTKMGLMAARADYATNSPFSYFVGGGIKATDPLTSQLLELNPLGDIFANISASDRNYGPWYSFAGNIRGVINNVRGTVVNFGTPARALDLDELANKQINMVVNKGGVTKLWGSFSGQFDNNQRRFINIVRLIIFLQKSLKPLLEDFLEEPNDIPTWSRIYYTAKPFMDSLVTKRAMYSYSWDGDQFAKNMDSLQINNASDVSEGKYRIRCGIKATPSLQEINFDLVLTPAGIQFELIDELT